MNVEENSVARWNGRLAIAVTDTGVTPTSTDIIYGRAAHGYIRDATAHDETSLTLTVPIYVDAIRERISVWVQREAAAVDVDTIAIGTFISIKRLY